jgi:hypothetical protein
MISGHGYTFPSLRLIVPDYFAAVLIKHYAIKTTKMNITNSQSKSVEQIFSEVQQQFPKAELKKPFLSPRTIIIPHDNFKFLLRYKKNHLQVDFTPPVLWLLGGMLAGFALFTVILSIIFQQFVISFGGVIPVIAGVLIIKAIFKSTKKDAFKSFEDEANILVNTNNKGI